MLSVFETWTVGVRGWLPLIPCSEKYIKFLKNDIAKAWDIPKKVLFGKKVPISGASLAREIYQEIELERVKRARLVFEEMIREKLKEEGINSDDLELKWDDWDIIKH